MLLNNKWLKLIAGVIILYIIYQQYSSSIPYLNTEINKINQVPLAPVPKSGAEIISSPSNAAKLSNPECDCKIQSEVGFVERKVAGIMASFVETPQGQDFFRQLIRPFEPLNTQLRESEKINGIIDSQVIKLGVGNEAGCGAQVEIFDQTNNIKKTLTLGENQYHNLDSIIALMKISEERVINLIDNKKYHIILKSFKNCNEEWLNYYHNNYGALPGCGQQVALNFTITSADVKFNYDHFEQTKKLISIDINAQNLSNRLLGMLYKLTIGGNVISFFTYNNLQNIIKENPKIFNNLKLPNKELFALDIKLVSANPQSSTK